MNMCVKRTILLCVIEKYYYVLYPLIHGIVIFFFFFFLDTYSYERYCQTIGYTHQPIIFVDAESMLTMY